MASTRQPHTAPRGARRRRGLAAIGVVAAVAASLVAVTAPPASAAAPLIIIAKAEPAWDVWYERDVTTRLTTVSAFPRRTTGLSWVATGADPGTGASDGSAIEVVTDAEGLTRYDVTAVNDNGEQSTRRFFVGIDKTAPQLQLGPGLSQGMIVGRGATVPFSVDCSDAHAGVVACETRRPSNGFLDTSTTGTHSFDLVTVDRVGNQRFLTFTYEVLAGLQAVTAPVVTGALGVGSTLTVAAPTFRPAASAVSYYWYADDVRVGEGPTLSLLPEHLGRRVHVVAVGSRDTFEDGASGRNVGTVAAGQLAVTGVPRLVGPAVVGATVTAVPPTSTPTAESVGYQWLRSGTPIAGADDVDYTVAGEDLGRTLSVAVTLSRTGYDDHTARSTETARVTGPALAVTRPAAVTGAARPGGVLTAVAPVLSGTPDAVAYQWLRDDRPVAGATGTTYRLTAADAGHRVGVRARATTTDRADTVSTSRSVTVAKVVPVLRATGTSPRARTVTLRVTLSAPGVRPTGALVVKRGRKVVTRARAAAGRPTVVTLKRQPRGTVTYTVAYSGDAATAARTVRTPRIRVR